MNESVLVHIPRNKVRVNLPKYIQGSASTPEELEQFVEDAIYNMEVELGRVFNHSQYSIIVMTNGKEVRVPLNVSVQLEVSKPDAIKKIHTKAAAAITIQFGDK